MKSINPNMSNSQIKSKILNNVDSVSLLSNKCVSGGRLNAYRAIKDSLLNYSQWQSFTSYCSIPTNGYHWYKITITSPGIHTFSKQYNSLILRGDLYSDIQGNSIASGTTASGTLFSYTFGSPGTYYLKITNCGSSSGSYFISIN